MKRGKHPITIYHMPIPLFFGIVLLILAFKLYQRGVSIPICLGLALGGLLLIARWLRPYLHREIEDVAQPASASVEAPRPIEPDNRNPLRVALLVLIAVAAVILEVQPIRDFILEQTPYRVVPTPWGCAAPLHAGDQVWVRVPASALASGSVVWMGRDQRRARRELGTIHSMDSDSMSVAFRSGPSEDAPRLESRVIASARGVGLAIVFPPTRWRRLP